VTVSATPDRLDTLRERLRAFVAERDWDQFHTPKNLAMALVAEAGELVEHFQWLTAEESERLGSETRAEVELEIADVLLFLLRLCDRLGRTGLTPNCTSARFNAQKYPVHKERGRAATRPSLGSARPLRIIRSMPATSPTCSSTRAADAAAAGAGAETRRFLPGHARGSTGRSTI
jgi:NTP pyrophosphatase (non-canonical NTP hydrolase)